MCPHGGLVGPQVGTVSHESLRLWSPRFCHLWKVLTFYLGVSDFVSPQIDKTLACRRDHRTDGGVLVDFFMDPRDKPEDDKVVGRPHARCCQFHRPIFQHPPNF